MGKASKKKGKAVFEPEKGYSEPGRIKADFLFTPVFHVLLIVVIGLLVYSNTFQVSFLFDDKPNIVDNPLVKNFSLDYGYEDLKRRLVGYMTFALDYTLHGLDVTGYHVFNLMVHLTNALLVYWLVVLSFKTPVFSCHPEDECKHRYSHHFIALFAALLFVSHPIQTQAVTYIVQRFASLATLFYLFSLVMSIKARLTESSTKRYSFYAMKLLPLRFFSVNR